jgi:cell wall-associated NlpC family hydrolase
VSDSVGIYYKTLSPRGEVVYIKKNLCVDSQFWLQHKNPSQADIATAAQRFLGTPYWWGAASTLAIDCSGFTKSVWALQGLLLQRDASQQANYGKIVATKPDILRLQVGDLLFFGQHKTDSLPQKITHVAIYLGNKQFIHASHSVRISSLDSLQQSDDRKYMKSFILARRFLGNEGKPGCQYISKNPLYSRILPSN